MAKQAPKRVTPKTAPAGTEAASAPAPKAKAAASSFYTMSRAGIAEGQSGATYKYNAGDTVKTPEGDLDHLGERYCVKK